MQREDPRDPRYDVTVDASFRNATVARSPVRVKNLSASGCRFSSQRRLETGSLIVLAFGEAATVEATVRWRFGGAHGVRFATALGPGVLDHIRLFLSEQPALVAEREPAAA